jgi:hypothetical protein
MGCYFLPTYVLQNSEIKLDDSTKKSIHTNLARLTLDLSFLVNLTAAEIRRSLKIGPESRTFALKILLLAKTNPEMDSSLAPILASRKYKKRKE